MLNKILSVKYLEDYKLVLRFEDQSAKKVNFEKAITRAWHNRFVEKENLLIELHDLDFFRRVRCSDGTISWPNGLDLCPDVLFAEGETI